MGRLGGQGRFVKSACRMQKGLMGPLPPSLKTGEGLIFLSRRPPAHDDAHVRPPMYG